MTCKKASPSDSFVNNSALITFVGTIWLPSTHEHQQAGLVAAHLWQLGAPEAEMLIMLLHCDRRLALNNNGSIRPQMIGCSLVGTLTPSKGWGIKWMNDWINKKELTPPIAAVTDPITAFKRAVALSFYDIIRTKHQLTDPTSPAVAAAQLKHGKNQI